ncbi:MAG: hypothetical protein KHZ15_05310 [Coprobacillus cateniformis]|uniref:hypothetical protein n=1 Tax=Longibaculum muris TaxID=1796628 RepID=UPI003AB21E3C|nr:hypothetical protein [Coprobacillus cateniformis]
MKKVLKIWLVIAMMLSIGYQSIFSSYATQTEKIKSLQVVDHQLKLIFVDSTMSSDDFTFAIGEKDSTEPTTYDTLANQYVENEKNYTLYMKASDGTVETYDFDTIAPKPQITKEFALENDIYTKATIHVEAEDAISFKVMKDSNIVAEFDKSTFEVTDPKVNKIIAVDQFGNQTSIDINLSAIHTTKDVLEMTMSPTTGYSKSVKASIKEVKDCVYGFALKENVKDIHFDSTREFEITVNGTYVFAIKNTKTDIVTKVEENITNIDREEPIVGVATLSSTPSIDNENINKLGYAPFHENVLQVKVPITDSISGIDAANTKLILKKNDKIVKTYDMFSMEKGQFIFHIDVKDELVSMYLSTQDNLGNLVKEEKLKYQINSKVMTSPILLDTNVPTITNEQINVDVKTIDKKDWIRKNATLTYSVSDIVEKTTCSGIQSIQTKVNGVEKTVDVKTDKKVENQTISIQTDNYKANNDGSFEITIIVVDNAGNETTFTRNIYLDIIAPAFASKPYVIEDGKITLYASDNVDDSSELLYSNDGVNFQTSHQSSLQIMKLIHL